MLSRSGNAAQRIGQKAAEGVVIRFLWNFQRQKALNFFQISSPVDGVNRLGNLCDGVFLLVVFVLDLSHN